MNIYQRIVLILGAIALVVVIWTSPDIIYSQDLYDSLIYGVDSIIRIGILSVRMTSIIGSTLFIFFALKGIKK